MKQTFLIAFFCCCIFSITASQYSYNLPVDTITSGQFNDKHPTLSTSMFLWNSAPQWLLFERHTIDSSFIVGKRYDLQKFLWDSLEVVIASSSAASPLVQPGLAAMPSNAGITFCAVWQKNINTIGKIYYSFYNDSIGHWTEPQLLAGDSLSHENPAVRVMQSGTSKKNFSIVWSRKNAILHTTVTPGFVPFIDTLAHSNLIHPKFDFTDYNSNTFGLIYTLNGDSSRMRLCKTIYSPNPLQILSTDTVPGSISVAAHPHFVQSFFSATFLWEENDIIAQRIMGASLYYFSPQEIPGTVDGIKYDVKAYTLPIITMSQPEVPSFLYINVLSYTRENGIDTVVMIHSPGLFRADTIQSKGYNSSSSIGSFMCLRNGTNYTLVVWESNRTGNSHIYGKLVYNPLAHVKEEKIVPNEFTLFQNYPNPFNPITTIGFTLQKSGLTSLKVYDVLGRELTTLVNEYLEAGVYHQKVFDASALSSGIYFVRLQCDEKVQLIKMSLMK